MRPFRGRRRFADPLSLLRRLANFFRIGLLVSRMVVLDGFRSVLSRLVVFCLCLFLVLPAGCVLSCFPLCFLFLLLLRFRCFRLCCSPVRASASAAASAPRSSKVFRLGSPTRRDQGPASSRVSFVDCVPWPGVQTRGASHGSVLLRGIVEGSASHM